MSQKINGDFVKDIYSTKEIKTNKVWVDEKGKEHTVYRKVIEDTMPQNTDDTNFAIKEYDFSGLNIERISVPYAQIYSPEIKQVILSPFQLLAVIDIIDKKIAVANKTHYWNDNIITMVVEYIKTNE